MADTRTNLLILAIYVGCVHTAPAVAHKPSDSYLKITGGGERLTAQWDIALKDLEFLIGLDADQNGEITWGELRAQRPAIAAHALSRMRITADGRDCPLQLAQLLVTRHSDGAYAVLAIETDCPGDAAVLNVEYNLLFDIDPTHRGLVLYTNGAVAATHVLSPDKATLELRTTEPRLAQSFVEYVREGVWHIWIGYDHILFLLSLLLPAVLRRRENSWQPVEVFGPACIAVLKIVTVFTLAHSITLWLAVMEYVSLPSWLVESTIALSIVVTALNNLYPVLPLSGWAIAFVFGLVHGFGFANVLVDLGLSHATLALALLGFNVGVELGQMAIVLVFFPVAYLLRSTLVYQWLLFRVGTVLIAVIAALWMYERLFNTAIL
jgi:HupE / UreJ protein